MHRAIRAGLTVFALLGSLAFHGDEGGGRAVAQDRPGTPQSPGPAAPAEPSDADPANPPTAGAIRTLRTVTRFDEKPSVAFFAEETHAHLAPLGPFSSMTQRIDVGDAIPARAVLLVARESALQNDRESLARAFIDGGGVVFVDEWGGDEWWLTSLAPGGTARVLTTDDAVLHRFRGLEGAAGTRPPTLVGVVLAGEVRVIAARERTLCRDPWWSGGHDTIGEQVVRHAWDVTLRTRPTPPEPPVAMAEVSLAGRRLVAAGVVNSPNDRGSTAHLRLLALDGTVVAAVTQDVWRRQRAVLRLDVELPVPFDVLAHRLELTREDAISVDRRVETLLDAVGATEILVGHTGWVVEGAPASVRAFVRNSRTGEGVADCPVKLALRNSDEATISVAGRTDAAGTVSLAVDVPDTGAAPPEASMTWVLTAYTPLRTEECRTSTSLAEALSGHILPDVPVHRPGDVLRFRLLALRQPSGRPVADRTFDVELFPPGGRSVANVSVTTNAHGVASGEVRVPASAATGDHELRVWGLARTTVRVESFETPRFRLTLDGVPRTATPGGRISGALAVSRFDGTAMPAASVSVRLRTDDIGAAPLARWEGTTGDDGRAAFTVDVPADAPTERGSFLDVAVVDAGGRTVREAVRLTWRRVVAEMKAHSRLVFGHRGTVLVRTDLAPATAVDVSAGDGPVRSAVVDDLGFVEVDVPRAAGSNTISVGGRSLTVEAAASRLDVAPRVVPQGTPVRVRFTTRDGGDAVFLDVLWRDTVLATHRLRVVDGVAAADLTLPDAISGPVTFRATTDPGRIEWAEVSETAFVVPRESLRVELTPRPADLRPGDPVDIGLRVTDATGVPRTAVVALRVVDEAVLSLVAEPIDVVSVTLATGAERRRWREPTSPTLTDLAAIAARRSLSPAESRLAGIATPSGFARTWFDSSESSLTSRRRQHLKAVDAAFEAWGAEFVRRATEVLAAGAAPGPSADVPDIATALRLAAARGAFGRDGLLDPWGTPVEIGGLRALPFRSGREEVGFRGGWYRPLYLRSAGPDGERTEDDTGFEDLLAPVEVLPIEEWLDDERQWIDDTMHGLSMRDTLILHSAWLRSSGRSFDVDEFLGHADWNERSLERRFHRRLRAGGGGMKSDSAGDVPEARVRSFFPEAILFAPLVLTDADGRAQVPITTPDSVTTWRADAVAHDAAGGVGQSDARFRTTLPFTADVDVPPSLVAGDEVGIPLLLRWTAAERRDVVADVEVAGPVELLSAARIRVGPGTRGEAAAFIRVRAAGRGTARLVVRCTSGDARDAVAREIDVVPAGLSKSVTAALRSPTGSATAMLRVPHDAIPGSGRAEVRLRTSPLDDLRDGLAGLLRQPHGCFEQASSAMFPNVLALSALDGSAALTPTLAEGFERAIRDGTDLLLKYEIPGGGFDWFGRAPAKLLLSAYGAQEWWMLHRLRRSRGREDPAGADGAGAIAMRTSRWLVAQQREDGSFPAEGVPYEWRGALSGELAATAYVGWALTPGRKWDPAFDRAVLRARDWVKPRTAECSDSYTFALTALFLAESGDVAAAREVAARLREKLTRTDGRAWLDGGAGSAFYGRGVVAGTEATALAAMVAARLEAADILPLDELLAALAARRRADGTWGTTQATVLALWALVDSKEEAPLPGTEFRVRAEGMPDRVFKLDDTPGAVRVDVSGLLSRPTPVPVSLERPDGGPVTGSLVVSYDVPWSVAEPGPESLPLTVTRTLPARARVGVPFEIGVTVGAKGDRPVEMPIVVVPLPAGMLVDEGVLRLRPLPAGIERIESGAERVTLYLRVLAPGASVAASIPVTPRLRGRVTAAPAEARPYYEPDAASRSAPAVIVVE